MWQGLLGLSRTEPKGISKTGTAGKKKDSGCLDKINEWKRGSLPKSKEMENEALLI